MRTRVSAHLLRGELEGTVADQEDGVVVPTLGRCELCEDGTNQPMAPRCISISEPVSAGSCNLSTGELRCVIGRGVFGLLPGDVVAVVLVNRCGVALYLADERLKHRRDEQTGVRRRRTDADAPAAVRNGG